MPFANVAAPIGFPQLTPYGLPDTTERAQSGLIVNAVDPYWGGGEFIYCKASATIRTLGLVAITQTISGGKIVYSVAEVASTAGMGRPLGVAMVPATIGQFLYVCVGGVIPVNSNSAIAVDSALGIAATAGQAGAMAAGKQILGARAVIASTTTVAKAGSTANSGSTRLNVSNADGLFIGCYLSGTGIAATTTVADIDPSGTIVTLSTATTAQVNGTVTGTYNNATIFYNVVHLNRPISQGQIL